MSNSAIDKRILHRTIQLPDFIYETWCILFLKCQVAQYILVVCIIKYVYVTFLRLFVILIVNLVFI